MEYPRFHGTDIWLVSAFRGNGMLATAIQQIWFTLPEKYQTGQTTQPTKSPVVVFQSKADAKSWIEKERAKNSRLKFKLKRVPLISESYEIV